MCPPSRGLRASGSFWFRQRSSALTPHPQLFGLIFTMHSESVAQVAEARALVGMWEGRHEGANIKSDAARIEFREVDGRVRWTMRREGVAFDNKLEAQASGVVVKAEPPVFELEGKYDSHNFRSPVGQPLRYTLTLTGETLEGTAVGVTGNRSPARFTRRKWFGLVDIATGARCRGSRCDSGSTALGNGAGVRTWTDHRSGG